RIFRTNADFNAALARPENAQPLRPRKSTALNIFSRSDKPSRRMRAYCSSAFNNAMFTFEGHSVVQALHERQLLNASSSSVARKTSAPPNPRCSSTARIVLARPRVDMISSPVAINVGHIVALSLRQPPQPLHCSRLPTKDASLAANARVGSKGSL